MSRQGERLKGVTWDRRGQERDKSRVRASVESTTERQRIAVNANGRRELESEYEGGRDR